MLWAYDDQGLYCFRGATIRNILLNFQTVSTRQCAIFSPFDVNFRSDPAYLDFITKWMDGSVDNFHGLRKWAKNSVLTKHCAAEWEKRHSKSSYEISGSTGEITGTKKVLIFDQFSWREYLQDWNQVTFPFSPRKNDKVKRYSPTFLRNTASPVYTRVQILFFFEREETGSLLAPFLHFANI